MYKQRIINGLSEKYTANPLALHSLFKNYIQTSLQNKQRQNAKTNNNIQNIQTTDQSQFNVLVKGLRVRASRNEITQKQSIEVIDRMQSTQKKIDKASRPRSKKPFVVKNKITIKSKITENKKIKAFFRNQLISLLTLLNRKQNYFSYLKAKRIQSNLPMKASQIQETLIKLIDSKGKDKGRIKFNYMTNQQLRSLKYKAKPLATVNLSKKAKIKNGDYVDVDSGQEQQQQKLAQENMDMATWKRKNGCGYNQKVFIVKGGYYELRKTLADRGWFQNQDVYSPFFDLKWTTQTCDIDFSNIKSGQIVNHFNNNHHLTSKYGLARRLKTLVLSYGIDIDQFYPRCFDLGDLVDFQNFIQNFKFSFAQSCAKRFLVDKKRYKGLQLKIRYILNILRRRALSMTQTINMINNGSFPAITPQQWEIITQTIQWDESIKQQKTEKARSSDPLEMASVDKDLYQQKLYEIFDLQMRSLLQRLGNNDPQLQINGFRNVWIAKPNFLSRGRGIKCLNNLYDIADYCLGKDCQFVIQKYIQNPLLINGKKFDIRQWVLVQDFNPAIIWCYQECYLRFCCDQFSLDNINNRFLHLTNNSIQKYNKNAIIDESMWEMKTFIDYIGLQKWKIIQQKIKNIIVWSIKSCQGCVTGKKGFFQMVGYDFMIDENLNPWLIQINMSPSMDYSTPVTKKLVKMVQRDMGNIISSSGKKKQKNAGLFTCIYRGQQDLSKYKQYCQ